MNNRFLFLFSLEFWALRFCLGIGGSSKSSQASSTSSSSTIYDSRVALADDAAYATGGGVVDRSANDNRTFDDHSTFTVAADDNSVRDSGNIWDSGNTTVDARDLSDRSTFSLDASQTDQSQTTITDARDLSDRSTFSDSSTTTTNITTADPETLKELARGAFSAAELSTNTGARMLESLLDYGDKLTERAMSGVSADRAFAGDLVNKVVETTKSADQQNTEKIVKGATYLGGGALAAFVLVKIFGKK